MFVLWLTIPVGVCVRGLIQRCQGHMRGTGHVLVLDYVDSGHAVFVCIFMCLRVFMWQYVFFLKTPASQLLSQLMSFIRVQGSSLEMFNCVCLCLYIGMLYVLYISVLTIKYSSHFIPQRWIYGNHIKVCFHVLPSFSILLHLGLCCCAVSA